MSPVTRVEVTLKDVAERAGVSTAAVSQALNDRGSLREETRERIKSVAAELGYTRNTHAAALRGRRALSIGFVMADEAGRTDSPRWALQRTRQLSALVHAAAEQGFTVTVIADSRPDLVGSAPVDAVYFPDSPRDHAMLRAVTSRGIPLITNDVYVDAEQSISIRTGYDDAVRASLDLLEQTGAKRIALLRDDSQHPRDTIGETAYRAWSAVRGRDEYVAVLDAEGHDVPRTVRSLLDGGVDGIVSLSDSSPAVYLQLEASALVLPRDVQLIAVCAGDCDLYARLGMSRVCVHPEDAPTHMFAALATLAASADPQVIDLPWHLTRGTTTR